VRARAPRVAGAGVRGPRVGGARAATGLSVGRAPGGGGRAVPAGTGRRPPLARGGGGVLRVLVRDGTTPSHRDGRGGDALRGDLAAHRGVDRAARGGGALGAAGCRAGGLSTGGHGRG